MEIFTTIIPLFSIILLGWAGRQKGLITQEFLEPANRLVYSFSIPALIFGSIAKTSFHQRFDLRLVLLTLLAISIAYLGSFLISRAGRMSKARAGTFIISSAHSNVGYLGLPISYYYLGADGFSATGILCGFVMIAQNVLSVLFLQMHQEIATQRTDLSGIFRALAGNPVIVGALAGMVVSFLGIGLPAVFWRLIDILGGLAPPMALLLIGASLSLRLMRSSLAATLGAICIKLVLLPALAVALFQLFHLKAGDYLPAIILLCSPAATIVFVMAKNMHCDSDFAVTQISLGTLVSSLTFIAWLAVIPHPVGG